MDLNRIITYTITILIFTVYASTGFSQNKDCQSFLDQAKQTNSKTEIEKLYRKAAECGDEPTQYYLGTMYYDVAEELRKDFAKSTNELEKSLIEANIKSTGNDAIKYLKMAANNGHPGAQAYLCLVYYEGHFVDENYNEARSWAKKVESNHRSTSKEKASVEAVLNRIEMWESLGW